MIQIGGIDIYIYICQEEGIFLQEHRDRHGRCIAILFKTIGVGGRFDPRDQEKLSRNEKAILGTLGEFRVFSEQLSEFRR